MGATKSKKINKNVFKKVYPYVRRRPVYTSELDKETIIETGRVYFDATASVTYTFVEKFTAIPMVTAVAEIEDLNVFITLISTTNVTINTSDTYTGRVNFHAIYVSE